MKQTEKRCTCCGQQKFEAHEVSRRDGHWVHLKCDAKIFIREVKK